MLFRLTPREQTRAEPDVVALALACHDRIRQASATTLRLAGPDVDAEPAELVAEAAEAVRRYYTLALPLHSEDEDASFAPRLRERAADATLDEALSRLAREHATIEAQTAELSALLSAVASEPGRIRDVRADVARIGAALAAGWEAHLATEEALVFPAARRVLAPEDFDAIRAEMRTRRASRGFSG